MTGKIKGIGGMIAAMIAGLAMTAGVVHADTLRWSGEVDDTGYIRLDGRGVRTDGNMRGVRDSRYNVDGTLPNRPTRVRLTNERGRGEITIVEQPSARNNYTAVVKVRDWQAGSSRYGFQAQWDNARTDRYDERDNRRNDKGRGNGNRRDDNGWGNGRRPN